MTSEDRRLVMGAPGSSERSTTRDRVALRSRALDEQYPKALDVEAEVLDLLHARLRGHVGELVDRLDKEQAIHLREALRGERHLHGWVLGRLLTSARPEAGQAIDDLTEYLARHRGRVVLQADDARLSLLAAGAVFARESGEALAAAFSGSPETAREAAEAVEAGKALVAAAVAHGERR